MEQCRWDYCNKLAFQITTKNIPLINVYSCDIHAIYYCKLCDYKIIHGSLCSNNNISNDKLEIDWHFIVHHTFKTSSRNYLYSSPTGMFLANRIYHEHGLGKLSRFCYMSGIIRSNPHFIYLVPEFSFSDVLDQFDEVVVPDWSLLAAMRNKSFSCLICGGLFESFPSSEVFNAHPCNEL